MEEIILDFTMSDGDVPKLSSEQMLQRAALDKTLKLLVDAVKRAEIKKTADTIFYNRSHNSILINGSRGTGKSTFIRFIIETIENNLKEKKFEIENVDKLKNIHPLKVIDPTLISSKENIVILIITLIKEGVNKSGKSSGTSEYKKWKESLSKLAGGLWNIDGVGANHLNDAQWSDKDYILEVGLERSNRGLNLERDFNSFVNDSLKLLGKDCFLIVFDDVDTQFERGWPVLECIRKYLTSPEIIIIISGDLDLFSTLVRTEIRKSFQTKNSLLSDNELGTFDKQVSTLEEQYLLKIIKPENRISLRTMWFEHSQTKSSILYKYNNVEPLRIESAFNLFCKKHLRVHGQRTTGKIMQSILRLPLRSNISIAKNFEMFLDDSKSVNSIKHEINESIVQGFTTILNKNGVNPEYIKDPDNCAIKILKEKWKIIDSKAYTAADFSIFDCNYLDQLPLAFLLSKYSIKKFHTLARVLYLDLYLEKIYGRLDENSPIIRRCKELLNSNFDLSRVFWELSIYAFYMHDKNRVFIRFPDNEYKTYSAASKLFGMVEDRPPAADIQKYLKTAFELSDSDFDLAFQSQSNIVYASLRRWFLHLRYIYKGKRGKTVAFYNKLHEVASLDSGSIHEFLNLSSVKILAKKNSEIHNFIAIPILLNSIFDVLDISDNDYDKFKKLLSETILGNKTVTDPIDREYVDDAGRKNHKEQPKDTITTEDDYGSHSDDSGAASNLQDERYDNFSKALYIWARHASEALNETSIEEILHLINKYIDRVDDINKASAKNFMYSGYLFYINIVNVLNDAFLFKETRHTYLGEQGLSFKTNINSARVFYENLNNKKSNTIQNDSITNSEVSVFRMLLSCPLIGMYLPIECDNSKTKPSDGVDFVFKWHEKYLRKIIESNELFDLKFSDYKDSLYINLESGAKICFFEALNTVPYVNSGVMKSINLFDSILASSKNTSPSIEDVLGDESTQLILDKDSNAETDEFHSDHESDSKDSQKRNEKF